ncbi:hypothetical protein like AT4G01000 [Hibiscus trionum]|uniref:Ubiquitin-like domain-containing protein n=1 Tax=Hibiscus trionum TaxID=183268 RepID=A0A9W7HZI4_HIBTR|nr:hypothetical protein like AT4G01000 [Hibiscus trionum]
MVDLQISGNDIKNKDLNRRQLQLFVKLLNGGTLSLQFPTPQVQVGDVKHRIQEITQIPINFQRLIRAHQLNDDSVISQSNATINLSLRLLGGKGGFGSLLRGAATKAGQKKTSNFEACRDMSGRRLRHVNAEKRLEEWKAGEEQRKLEKIAEDFIKKKAKTGKKGVGDGEAEKYVAKYREESARCMVVVEESVRAACQSGKRKAVPGGADHKKIEDLDGKEENSSKGTEGISGSVSGGNQDIEISGGASSETGSEEEKEVVLQQSSESCGEDANTMAEEYVIAGSEAAQTEIPEHNGTKTEDPMERVSQHFSVQVAENGGLGSEHNNEVNCSSNPESGVRKETVVSNAANITEPEKPLNFDDFNSSEEMEVLGLERLKSELQACGLKCGGTLKERGARVFLLKSTPLDKLPKKLLAKK